MLLTPEPDLPPSLPPNAYTYPEHLRASLEGVPAAPGVYTFHAPQGQVPLYIGKSINLRARLLSHFRNPQEARLLRQASHITCERTAGDLGALLREAQRIKQEHPIYNQKLRRNRQLCALRLQGGVPEVVSSKDVDFAHTPHLYGLFASPHAARAMLQSIADAHGLCWSVLGLERLVAGRACFRRQIRKCAGACVGALSAGEHADRLLQALRSLQVQVWPYEGTIGLVEQGADMTQVHVLRDWLYLGSAPSVAAARKLVPRKAVAGFDADSYRLVCGPLLSGQYPVVPLAP